MSIGLPRYGSRRRLVIETDIFSDVDDVGALALAHRLTDLGAAELVAVMVNTPSVWGPQAVDIINGAFGRHDLPVGALLPTDRSEAERGYTRQIVEQFADSISPQQFHADSTSLWRQTLAAANDDELVVVSIGFFGNLSRLLRSGPDEYSSKSGQELVKQKVRQTIVMGGAYPEGLEFNFAAEPAETRAFLDRWPTPIQFVGWEAGAEVLTGGTRVLDPARPEGFAYELFCGADMARESWDLIAVHLAVDPDSPLYSLSEPGRVEVAPDGYSKWTARPDGSHRLVRLAANEDVVASSIDALLSPQGPARSAT